jgi:hypothetical protein
MNFTIQSYLHRKQIGKALALSQIQKKFLIREGKSKRRSYERRAQQYTMKTINNSHPPSP